MHTARLLSADNEHSQILESVSDSAHYVWFFLKLTSCAALKGFWQLSNDFTDFDDVYFMAINNICLT